MIFTTLILLVLLVLLVIALLPGIVIYNRLTRLRNAIANAFAQIDVQLKRRLRPDSEPGRDRAQIPAAHAQGPAVRF